MTSDTSPLRVAIIGASRRSSYMYLPVVRHGDLPSYGPHQARLDQEIILALRQSAKEDGRPVCLPLDPAGES